MKFVEKELNKEVFTCQCRGHALSFMEFIDGQDPRLDRGITVNEDFDGYEGEVDYVSYWLEFWFGVSGPAWDTKWDRLKGAVRLLRGRYGTFDDYHFDPGELRELGEFFIRQADRAKELGFNDEGVRKLK